uniref:Uncharacterized protein n=1 Tax=Parascaris univalens TaxID=6257 RepID=A0A915C6K3_PARUN
RSFIQCLGWSSVVVTTFTLTMLPLKILSFIFSIHHCSLVILYFALLFHILLCAKKKNTKSDTTPIKKNDNVNGAKTFPVAGKNAALGEDDPDPTSRVPQLVALCDSHFFSNTIQQSLFARYNHVRACPSIRLRIWNHETLDD